MKIPNVITSLPKDGNGNFLTYADLLAHSVRHSGAKGMTVGQIRERSKLLDKLEAIEADVEEFELNEEMFSLAKNLYDAFDHWTVVADEICDLADVLVAAAKAE